MTSEELKLAYKNALDAVAAKQATVTATQVAYGAACAELSEAETAAAGLLYQLQTAITEGTL